MKILFFGTAKFAVPVLNAILKTNHEISGVVTRPDRPGGRGRMLAPSPAKAAALEKGIACYQPEDLKETVFLNRVEECKPDIFIVVSYGNILHPGLLAVPRLCPLNIHASLLPKYRGASPIQWALINGNEKTGVTIIKMTEKLDAGPILLKEDILIGDEDDAITLSEKLSHLAAEMIVKAVKLVEEGPAVFTPQDDRNATYAPKLHKNDGLINWGKSAGEIFNRIRGMQPWPGTFTYWNGKLLKVWKAKVSSSEGVNPHPGEVESAGKDGIVVTAACGKVLVEELQLAGGRRLPAGDFISGHNLFPGTVLG